MQATPPEASLLKSLASVGFASLLPLQWVIACGSQSSASGAPVGVSIGVSDGLPKTPRVTAPILTSATVPPESTSGAHIDGAHSDAGLVPAQRPPIARVLELGYRVKEHRAARRVWRQVETLNWQAVSEPEPFPAEASSPSPSLSLCPLGMQFVHGRALMGSKGDDSTDEVERLQDTSCIRWSVPKRICAEFSKAKWDAARSTLPTQELAYCMDRYEYPNRAGEYPLTVVTYSEAAAYCKRENKRLCTETEWTFACEGEEALPYPYGYVRDAAACPIDRPRIEPEEDTFVPRTTHRTAVGIDAMWQGERAGAYARCVSPFGVHDMTGNVDEWTQSVRTWGYRMILKGGHWSYVRGRCRPQTRGHGPKYVNVETGFRCCTQPEKSP